MLAIVSEKILLLQTYKLTSMDYTANYLDKHFKLIGLQNNHNSFAFITKGDSDFINILVTTPLNEINQGLQGQDGFSLKKTQKEVSNILKNMYVEFMGCLPSVKDIQFYNQNNPEQPITNCWTDDIRLEGENCRITGYHYIDASGEDKISVFGDIKLPNIFLLLKISKTVYEPAFIA